MSEVQTPETSTVTEAAPSAPSAAQKARDKRKRMKRVRNIILALVALAIVIALGYVLVDSMKEEEGAEKTIVTDIVSISSIQSIVEGNGVIRARDSASVLAPVGSTVKEVFVSDGDMVYEGQPLFTVDSSDAEEALATAQKKVDDLQKELNKLNEGYSDLTIRAPHAGKLIDTETFKVGEDASSGASIAVLVDDTYMKLSLYYSYAYEGQISVGQTASVSVPSMMGDISGTVTAVNYVSRVAPEGSVLFHVEIEFANPGTLTEGVIASATLMGSDGAPIYPYESVEMEYREKTTLTTKVGGEVLSVNLMDYLNVSQGDVLLALSREEQDLAVIAKEKELATAMEALTTAQNGYQNVNATAPMSGTVLSCSLKPDTKVESGMGITISDTTVMIVNANVEDRNIGYVSIDMPVNVNQNGNMLTGYVESISMEGTYENGTSVFPIVVRVDNPMGMLRSGMSIYYDFIASQSNDCLVVPIQCVRYTLDPVTGERISIVFVEGEAENSLDLSETELSIPDGFSAVQVETGISDYSVVEIISGLSEGQTVYTTSTTDPTNSYGW